MKYIEKDSDGKYKLTPTLRLWVCQKAVDVAWQGVDISKVNSFGFHDMMDARLFDASVHVVRSLLNADDTIDITVDRAVKHHLADKQNRGGHVDE